MTLKTNLRGRLRNTSLHQSNCLLPLFEAIVNSIHAIDDRFVNVARDSSNRGRIEVRVVREAQQQLNFEAREQKIESFKVLDDGVGFTEVNMQSFSELDSEHKANRGGRGVGRLLWLKAFEEVLVSSTFVEVNKITRKFTFDAVHGVKNLQCDPASNDNPIGTCVELSKFIRRFQQCAPRNASQVANEILEHCLWYFLRESGAPFIIIKDGSEVIHLDDLFENFMLGSSSRETIIVKHCPFELTHIKARATNTRSHSIAYCAASRVVKIEGINGKLPGLYGKLADTNGEFVYYCYVGSSFLDERVRSERTDFEISEDMGTLFDTEISLKDIRSEILSHSQKYLAPFLQQKVMSAKSRAWKFVSDKAPRYRPIVSKLNFDNYPIDPEVSDKDLDLLLHKHLAELESRLISDGHELLSPKINETYEDYRSRLNEYLETAQEIKKSDLANYVFHRRVVLDLFKQAIRRGTDGKYSREDLIHNLIMPMGVESNEVQSKDFNLWLIDERLAFHDYLASDKTLSSMPISDSTETKEPDLLALNVFDNPILVSENDSANLASIVVVEIKRPMRNDAAAGEEKDPIEQALGYLNRIRDGVVKTASGRLIPDSSNIPGYCYVLCDLTPSVVQRCKFHDATRTSDGMGYFFFHKAFSAYVEVISFDRLVTMAEQRNRAFFDKIGLPSS